MNKNLWLVDVDGTVIDKKLMWEQLEQLFHNKFPDIDINFRSYYDAHKGELHSVNKVMNAMVEDFGIDKTGFRSLFDEVDYAKCFDHEGWRRLQEKAGHEGFGLAFFTQGTRWVQEAKQRQLNQITGELPWHIFEDNKIDHLGEVSTQYEGQGIWVVGLVDDLKLNRDRAGEIGLRTAEGC